MIEQTLTTDISNKKSSRKTLLAMFFVSFMPIVAAYFMFFSGVGVPGKTVNSGVLFDRPISLKALFGENSSEWLAIKSAPKWRLLIPIGTSCPKACEQNLYTTRQVHIRLGEKSARLERVLINIGGTVGQRISDKVIPEHPRIKPLNVHSELWSEWLLSGGLSLDSTQQPYYFLVDQEGFAMMYYTAEHHGNALLKDIKRALKYSIDYE
jgi:hypothetical protein